MNGHSNIFGGQPWAIKRESLTALIDQAGRINPEAVSTSQGGRLPESANVAVRNGVAIVPVVGPIFRYDNWFLSIFGGVSVESLARDIRTAADNPVREGPSPGGGFSRGPGERSQ